MKKNKVKNKVPKFEFGTLIENPATDLYENQLAMVRASQKAGNNGWVKGLKIFGNLAQQVGTSMMNKGVANGEGADGKGVAGFLNKNNGDIQSGMGMMGAFSQFLAMGGLVPGVPVEVEGEEVGETPQGDVVQFKGPSHEQGGIDVALPEGTEMFSKRIKVDGVSMADRKKKREKRTMTLEQLLEKNPSDSFTKNSLKRTSEVNDKEDKFDSNIQELVKNTLDQKTKEDNHLVDINEKQKFQGGGTVIGDGKGIMEANGNPILGMIFNMINNGGMLTDNAYGGYGDGTRPPLATPGIVADGTKPKYSITGKKLYSNLKYDDVYDEVDRVAGHLGLNVNFDDPNSVKEYQKAIGIKSADGKFGKDTFNITKKYLTPIGEGLKPAGIIMPELKAPELDLSKLPSLLNVGISNEETSSQEKTGKGTFNPKDILGSLTTGDALGLIGNYISTFGPGKNTKANRAGDTPNIDAFKNYGKKGLETLDKTKQYVNQVRDEKNKDLELSRTGSIKRNSNSARSINTVRALNLATDASVNNTKEETYNTFAEQMMSILGQESQMENQIDSVVMQGEQNRDLADRQDRDNYFTQLAQDISTKGFGLQETGKDINQIKERQVIQNLLNQLSNYGITIDSNGNLSSKSTTKKK